ncbi:MAG: Na/Pi cotransporter family protein [Desulfobacteraceae bacterium]|jgi:phosphate:Na+ symporter
MKKIAQTALVVITLSILCTPSLFAAGPQVSDISWGYLVVGLFGGLAFFLYGMEKMSEGMKKSAGNQMRTILAALTRNRVIGLFVGAFVTMVIQSSSATTVLLVSFVQSGLMRFAQSLGVILGADIGTTVTAQLIAFKLTDVALLMAACGFAMRLFGKSEKVRDMGEVILGFGILFYGMKLMSDAMEPLRSFPEFIQLLRELENPMLGIFVGAIFTAVVQSSSAFTGLVIVLAQQGLIGLEAGIPMIFGANIGTCVTAALASIGASREAKRVALAHVLFKIAGVLMFAFWIPTFADIIRTITAGMGAGLARQIANAHTLFNVGLGLAFLPLTDLFARLVVKILPDAPKHEDIRQVKWHLDQQAIVSPATAIDLARKEISNMARLVGRMLRASIVPFMSDEKLISKEAETVDEASILVSEIPTQDEFYPELSLIEGIQMREDKINFLQAKIKEYLISISRLEISDAQSNEIYGMIGIIKDMESIGDLIHRNMLPLMQKKRALEVDFSEEGKEELLIYHGKACRQLQRLKEAFAERDLTKAGKIMAKERKYLDLELKYRVHHLDRMMHERTESVKTHEVHLELMDLMKQIIVYSSNIAKTYLVSMQKKEGLGT